MRVRFGSWLAVFVKRFWSGTEINKMQLSDNRSGVLLSTAGTRLPVLEECVMLHLQVFP